jgi:nucleoside-diphosphate-sugar epimerase
MSLRKHPPKNLMGVCVFLNQREGGKMISSVFREDIERLVSDGDIFPRELAGATVLITGATGLIGSALLRTLGAADAAYGLHMRLVAHGRNTDRGGALAGECGARFIGGDVRKPLTAADLAGNVDYIFHCAAVTKSADMVARPVEVVTAAAGGAENMLELARERGSRGFVYLSSMEVYGQIGLAETDESALGYLDLSNPRSSYPESKRFCEALCAAYAKQYDMPVKIARLARTFGAGTPNDPSDMRVASQFARKALAGEDIELHTPGNSIANCCYTADVIRGLMTVLLKGENGRAYNIANPDASATVREMAELVAGAVCGGKIKVVVNAPRDIDARGYAPDVGFRLNADRLKALGWRPAFGLAEMYGRMLEDWRELSSI